MAPRKKTTNAVKRPRVVVLDSHAIIHRAYHALPELSSDNGEPTGALYGLCSMLIKIIQDLKPNYLLAAYDRPEATHRHEIYEAYKGTRQKTDDALVAQLERAGEVYQAFNIPAYGIAGYEADDVIGTIVTQLLKETDAEIIIASGDHDTMQLVDEDRVRVYTLRKGLADTVLYDEKAVVEKFGFGSDLIPDYKGLRGDPSDNIKGIAGIGEKTATELIQKFGTVEEIYTTLKKHPEKLENAGIKPRVIKLLEEGEEDAIFSKKLGLIKTDVPMAFSLPSEEWRESIDAPKIMELFDRLGFRSLGGRIRALLQLGAAPTEEETRAADHDPQLLKESSVALWLLRSDLTYPTAEDVLRFTKKDTIEEAHVDLLKQLRETGRLLEVFEAIEKPLIPIVDRMREVGTKLDVEQLAALAERYKEELAELGGRIFKHAGHEFNINSPRQLSAVLFDELGLSIARHKKTGTGQRSTKESELEKLKDVHPIINDILEYREVQKLLSTYIETLPALVGEDGRLHAEFLQAGTTTGRMASQNPNLQNIPIRTDRGRAIRSAFVAEQGCELLALDYSQIELRIAAGLSGDEKLTAVFRDGGDVHAAVASEVFNVPPELVDREMRRRAKIINFGILYGMGVNALRANLGSEVKRDEASKFLAEYFKQYAGLASYLERVKAEAAFKGYTETLFGRRRYFAGFNSPLPHVRAAAERMAINAPIQGTQADIIKLAMVRADERLKSEGLLADARLLLQVHDELVYEVKKESVPAVAKIVKEAMESIVAPDQLSGVPIVAESSRGSSWGSMEKFKII